MALLNGWAKLKIAQVFRRPEARAIGALRGHLKVTDND